MTDYFRAVPDPDRGYALAAITGALSFRHAKAGMIRALIAERADEVLFALSYDYVGDLSETVALMWPAPSVPADAATRTPLPPRSGGEGSGVGGSAASAGAHEFVETPPTPDPSPPRAARVGGGERAVSAALIEPIARHAAKLTNTPSLTHVVTTLAALGKTELPRQLAAWLDALDETGRWALLKLVTGALRIGVSARLAKTAVAALGDKQPDEIELVWHGLAPPYTALFAWIEGRAEKPVSIDPAPFRPVMLSHAIEEADFAALDPAQFTAEWKWDGIRVQAVAGHADGKRVARLYSRTGEDVSGAFPDLIEALTFDGAIDGELLILRDNRVQSFNVHAAAAQPQDRDGKADRGIPRTFARLRSAFRRRRRSARSPRSPRAARGWKRGSSASIRRASISRRWSPSRPGTTSPPHARIRPRRVPARTPRRSRA